MAFFSTFLMLQLSISSTAVSPSGPSVIRPCFDESCAPWLDIDGNRIEAHGAGLVEHDNRYYWFGESRKNRWPSKTGPGITLYTAPSLAGPWTYHGFRLDLYSVQRAMGIYGKTGDESLNVLERPKVLYNDATKMFVLWAHLDKNYVYRHAGVFISPDPIKEQFQFVRSFQPDGRSFLDFSLFKDPTDGAAYVIRDTRKWEGCWKIFGLIQTQIGCESSFATAISRLSPDYLNVDGAGVLNEIKPNVEGRNSKNARASRARTVVLSYAITSGHPPPHVPRRP